MSTEEEKEEPTQLHQEENPLEKLIKEQQQTLRLQDECIRLQEERIRLQEEQIRLQKEHIRLRDERIHMLKRVLMTLQRLSSDLNIRVQQLENPMNKDRLSRHQTFSGHYLYQLIKGLRKKGKQKQGRS